MCFLLQVHFSSLYECPTALYNIFAINPASSICFVFLSKCSIEWKQPHYLPISKENSLSPKGAILATLEIEIPVHTEETQHRQANRASPFLTIVLKVMNEQHFTYLSWTCGFSSKQAYPHHVFSLAKSNARWKILPNLGEKKKSL